MSTNRDLGRDLLPSATRERLALLELTPFVDRGDAPGAAIDRGACLGGLPLVVETVRFAELVHRALVRQAAHGRLVDCPELTGQGPFGQPRIGNHDHCHVLPLDSNRDERIDHVLLYAPMGFGDLAMAAIQSLRNLHGPAGTPWLITTCAPNRGLRRWLLGPGNANAGNATPTDACRDGSSTWVSLTPFVPPRHLKRSGRNSLEGQILAELVSRGFPPAEVEEVPEFSQLLRGIQRRRTESAAKPPRDIGFALRLTFPHEVRGPIALGYACHFGLGLFRAT
jgi:CRISPR-associated protein Csb2